MYGRAALPNQLAFEILDEEHRLPERGEHLLVLGVARIQSGIDLLLVPGVSISAQYYFRDALDPFGFGSGMSNAIRFTICP